MVSDQIKSDGKVSQIWNVGYGVTQRVVDIINQCRYLASKRRMTLKEIRSSMREDEANQRQLVRYAELCQQLNFLKSSNDGLQYSPSACPSWFAHGNNQGMMYSQYNAQQNYGCMGSSTVVADSWSSRADDKNSSHSDQINQRAWKYYSKSLKKEEKHENGDIRNGSLESADDGKNDNLLNLLYLSNKTSSMKSGYYERNNNNSPIHGSSYPNPSLAASSSSQLFNKDFIKTPTKVKEIKAPHNISLDSSESVLKCNLPVRTVASHNLASLCAAEGLMGDVDLLKMKENTPSNSSLELYGEDSTDSELDFSEVQIVEEVDREKTVKSPLIKKAESAFADLQKSDALFGTIDDFGDLMSQANLIL